MKIPAFDLSRQHAELASELESAASGVIRAGRFILGDAVERLETEVAALCGVPYGIGCASGSDALYLALLACGIAPGDEVITTPFTFFATAGAIERAGARPVFVDIDPSDFNLHPQLVEGAITPRTRAIIPVHLYGQPADMDAIGAIAARHGLFVIEDAAQAIGAAYKGRPVGSLGHVAAISFYPTKNLGGCGDGGMLVTRDPDLAQRLRKLRVHGSERRYYHESVGINSRLDEIQAAFLLVKRPHLPRWTERRRAIAARYHRGLDGLPLELPVARPDRYHVYHQYTVRTPQRDALRQHLQNQGIGTEVYYPLGLHLQAAFRDLGYQPGSFPGTERASAEVLSLPVFPELDDAEVDCVIEAIRAFFGSRT